VIDPFSVQTIPASHVAAPVKGGIAVRGRPTKFDYWQRGELAAALDLLIARGMTRSGAMAWLEPELQQSGVSATPKQIARWRDDARTATDGPDATRDTLARLREVHRRSTSSLDDAQRCVRLILSQIAQHLSR
jgi:hypothetical protein